MTDLRKVRKLWGRFDVTVRDLPLGLLFLGASLLPWFDEHGSQLGGMPTHSFDVLAAVALALECLPLAVRRLWPVVSLALVSLGFVVDQLRGYHLLAGATLLIALLSGGCHLQRHRRATVLLLTAAYVPLAVVLLRLGSGDTPGDFATFYLVLACAWGVGAWLRATRTTASERRRRDAEEARVAERARIARELHDVVTHHVTAMVVQVEAARYLTGAPERLDQTLTTVGDTGRRAITDLRHLLDLLSPDHGTEARTPHVGSVLTIVEQTRRTGQPVEFTEKGTPAESTGSADLVAYRVVQEALTNALKYAHGSRISVQIHHGEKDITVEVSTDGSGSPAPVPGGSGRGLAGLRERVDVLGGDFSAGRRAGGGFVVRARIPAGSPS